MGITYKEHERERDSERAREIVIDREKESEFLLPQLQRTENSNGTKLKPILQQFP